MNKWKWEEIEKLLKLFSNININSIPASIIPKRGHSVKCPLSIATSIRRIKCSVTFTSEISILKSYSQVVSTSVNVNKNQKRCRKWGPMKMDEMRFCETELNRKQIVKNRFWNATIYMPTLIFNKWVAVFIAIKLYWQ